ncbi:hypothetical protein LX36DRAFT_194794 [Colletotrichum falcatum]|nr:hypothetical protein LX36DRAFT_194794 [Colletotrichum falcatum]
MGGLTTKPIRSWDLGSSLTDKVIPRSAPSIPCLVGLLVFLVESIEQEQASVPPRSHVSANALIPGRMYQHQSICASLLPSRQATTPLSMHI